MKSQQSHIRADHKLWNKEKVALIMAGNSQKKFHSRWFIGTVALAVLLWIEGDVCLFAQSATGDEATETLSKLQVYDIPEPNGYIPEVYKSPPQIVEQIVNGKKEWKLFYFCKYLTSDELKQIIDEQYATKTVDPKGKETITMEYNVSSSSATNQLIVKCPAREDAEAVLETLNQSDVPPIQVKIDCLISEIYADFTYDREVTIAIENLFGEDIALKPSGTAFGADVQQLIEDDEYLPAFPGASLRELVRARMGLNIGYSSVSHEFTALIDLLESRGFLKILMNPTIETINGKTATVKSTQDIPLQRITKTIPGAGNTTVVQTETEYVDVIDSLEITPHVFADGYIGLETNIVLGLGNTPLGVKQTPILTKKEIINKENRIRHGESLIIGGMRKTERFGVTRGVPILKDIPLIGFLFSSEDTEERAVETVFILTPTISTNGRPREEIMNEIERKHESTHSSSGLSDVITDPFGTNARRQEQEQKVLEAEQIRLESEVEKANAIIAIREANERADKAQEELNKIKTEAHLIKAAAEQTTAEAQAKTKEAEQAKTDANKAQEQANKAIAEANDRANKAQEELNKIKTEAQLIKDAAEQISAEAQAKTKEAEQAKADAKKAQEQANKIIAETKADSGVAEKDKAEGATTEIKENPENTKEEVRETKTENDNADSKA